MENQNELFFFFTKEENMPIIYVLQLQENKYYVGYTARSMNERYHEHRVGEGSEWTRLYPPISVLEEKITSQIKSPKELSCPEEDRRTLEMIKRYGWDNVRGGQWCKINMQCPYMHLRALDNKIAFEEQQRAKRRALGILSPDEKRAICSPESFRDVCDRNAPLGNAIYHFSMQHKLWKAILSGEILFNANEEDVSMPSRLVELKEYIENKDNVHYYTQIFMRVVHDGYTTTDAASKWLC